MTFILHFLNHHTAEVDLYLDFFFVMIIFHWVILLAAILHQCDGWRLIGYDEFNMNTIDKNKWTYDIGDGCEHGVSVCGWGNHELETYTNSSKNSRVEDGKLIITAIKENDKYTSARLVTRGLSQWKFGKFEIKAQVPHGKGLWPAIWLLPSNNTFGSWPKSGEIDILEILGDNTSVAYCTAHLGFTWDNKFSKSRSFLSKADFATGYHIFEIIWELDKIEWFVDGNSVQVLTAGEIPKPYFYPFNEEFYLIINLAVGGNWPKSPNDLTEFPAEFKIEYVRIYEKT